MPRISLTAHLAVVALALGVCSARAQLVTVIDRGFEISTPRLSATVIDGVIVGLSDSRTGEVHADRATDDLSMPRGVGHMAGNVAAMQTLHCPWGNAQLGQDIPPGQAFPTMHFPSPEGTFSCEQIPGGLKATWTGLSNGEQQFPEESLTVECRVDESGQLLYRAGAKSDTAGVYGVQVPLANLHPEHAFYVASFGGVMYDKTNRPGLITLGGAPFWEASAIAAEGREGSLCVWVEDPTFRPNFCFLNWSGRSFSAAIEHLNLMPYEAHTGTESITWHLDVFPGGWVDAMTPYRNWYAEAFAPEMEIRAATTWADKIRVIVDHMSGGEEAYRELAANFDPETVLLHNWNARAPEFDRELPDWTPRAGFADSVTLAHRHGFRTMAYVNTYCINYRSPAFIRDGVQDFALLRSHGSISGYREQPLTWEDIKQDQLLYLDPLSAGWRRYHTEMMLKWREETGCDANYEDVGGTAGDFGSGVIDGLSGAQGGTQQFRELLTRNPEVPMASEYAPEHMAFAVRWPLRYQQVWGNEATRVWWMEHQRPISAYIHGPQARAWVPVIQAESDFARHVVAACSDALGGVAQIAGTKADLGAVAGMGYHMRTRAQLFAGRGLTPVFPKERWGSGVACLYEDREGRRYRYTVSPTMQELTAPDGVFYQRITGVNQVQTPLTLPGWPAAAEGKLLGLNPAIRYALCRGGHDRTKVQVLNLPEGIRIRRYESNALRTVLALEPVDETGPRSGQVALRTEGKFHTLLLNDAPAALPAVPEGAGRSEVAEYAVEFPAYLTFFEKSAPGVPIGQALGDGLERGRYIAMESGLERGGEFVIPFRANWPVPGDREETFLFLNWGSECEVTLDYVALVPDAETSVEVFVRNRQRRYGNGGIARLYINGRETYAVDLGPRPNPDFTEGMDPAEKTLWDTDVHGWRVPLGHLAGQPVAITIATDAKGSNNSDELWWTRPRLVHDAGQEPQVLHMGEGGGAGN